MWANNMHDAYRRMYETEWRRYSATSNCHQARVTRNCQIFLSKLLSSVVELCKFGTEVTLYLERQQHGSETKTGFTRRYVYRMRHSKYTMYTNGSVNTMDYEEIQYRDTDFVYPENVGRWWYFSYKVSRSKNDRRRWSISTNETVYFIFGSVSHTRITVCSSWCETGSADLVVTNVMDFVAIQQRSYCSIHLTN